MLPEIEKMLAVTREQARITKEITTRCKEIEARLTKQKIDIEASMTLVAENGRLTRESKYRVTLRKEEV